MTHKWPVIALIITMIVSISSCNSCRSTDDPSRAFEVPDSLMSDKPLPIAKPVMDEMMQNIASPLETAALMKALKVPFDKSFMTPTKVAEKFNTSFDKALALGIYGCDLGYINMYEKTSFVVDYITHIKRIADDIQVGQFFDFSTLKRLATNSENLDSIIFIAQQNFNRMDTYFKETNRSILSAVMVASTWAEGMFLTTKVAELTNHPKIRETLGEQKAVLGYLMALLKVYENSDPNMAALIADFEAIRQRYSNVTITYEHGEPEMVEVNGELTWVQNDKQTIHMDEADYKEIIASIQAFRNKLAKLN